MLLVCMLDFSSRAMNAGMKARLVMRMMSRIDALRLNDDARCSSSRGAVCSRVGDSAQHPRQIVFVFSDVLNTERGIAVEQSCVENLPAGIRTVFERDLDALDVLGRTGRRAPA